MSKINSVVKLLYWKDITNFENNRIFTKYEKFLANTLYSPSTNFEHTSKFEVKSPQKRSRLIKITMIKICSLAFAIRSFVSILWPTEYIRGLTCNGFDYLGSSILFDMPFLAGTLSGSLLLGPTQQYFILSGQSYQFEYMNKIKYRRLDYRLNRRLNNKFYRKFNWISKGVNRLFIPSFLFAAILYFAPTVMGYFDPEVQFTLIGI